jgi:hypothetical protein
MTGIIRRKGGRRWFGALLRAFGVATLFVSSGHAQLAPTGGQVVTPGSGIEKPGDPGVRAHTNIQLFIPNRAPPPRSGTPTTDQAPQVPGITGTEGTARPQ